MSIQEMKEYLAFCLEGESSIPARSKILAKKRETLRETIREIEESIAYIDGK